MVSKLKKSEINRSFHLWNLSKSVEYTHIPLPLLFLLILLTLIKILYLIFDYPHKHYTFKYFEV
nr:MAG TPA: hypothetical protein [Caudoviricetes sp.]